MELHVGKNYEYKTINAAAQLANPGDEVIVHEGVYRESVVPKRGGESEEKRILYRVADNETATILGSEPAKNWEKFEGTVWKYEVSNEVFGDWNPFRIPLMGDWVIDPYFTPAHLGDIYLNGRSIFEAASLEKVKEPEIVEYCPYETWASQKEPIFDYERTKYRWFAEVDEKSTTIYVNFGEFDPNKEDVEISVRKTCFFPKETGINYITVRGFRMGRAATPWAPPTGDQPGLIGPNFSKGWIIEDNEFFDAKCSCVSLGKESSTGDNDYTKYHKKPGYQYQLETVFKGIKAGWSKDKIGGHIVRRNKIHDCGQNGIVGNLGCAFSLIEDNEIYHISDKHEFYGHELGGIKFHGAIDTIIRRNYIHNCSLGTWLDWEAQGIRLSSNTYEFNSRDLMIEVTHGPAMIDNNIFADHFAIVNAAQGTAFVNNLFLGYIQNYDVRNRSTPYHYPHSTDVLGYSFVYGGDDRFYNNIFVGGEKPDEKIWGHACYGTTYYNGAPTSFEEYVGIIASKAPEDDSVFADTKQPAYINGNMYFSGAKGFDKEKDSFYSDEKPELVRTVSGGRAHYELELSEEAKKFKVKTVDSASLGLTRCAEEGYETPEGLTYLIDTDIDGRRRASMALPGPWA